MDDMNFEKLIVCCSDLKKTMHKKINESLKAYNITSVHVPYLVLLKKYDSLTMNQLNELLVVDKSNTARVINYLLKEKMIFKTDNIRKYKISLTEYGLKVIDEIEKNTIYSNNQILSSIEKNKLDIFNEVLTTIINKLKGE